MLVAVFSPFTLGPHEELGGGAWEEERVKGLPPWVALNWQVIKGHTKDALRAVFSQEGSFMQMPSLLDHAFYVDC
jgi:hypothetical protein